ncbi:hypothetical protein ZWY2020_030311 [Hordeum vulgare]|nr:hypothetical protein ZWY2020_030311 [Hordeum vulgare]
MADSSSSPCSALPWPLLAPMVVGELADTVDLASTARLISGERLTRASISTFVLNFEERMAVHYKYSSARGTFSLPLAAPSISVGDLRRLIMETGRSGHGRTRGRGPRETITISNGQTLEEYADDNALVLRNSTVVVARRVAGPPADTIVARPYDEPSMPEIEASRR